MSEDNDLQDTQEEEREAPPKQMTLLSQPRFEFTTDKKVGPIKCLLRTI